MSKTRFKHLLYLIPILLILGSCSRSKVPGGIDEGVLKYKITYLESEQDNPVISLLPREIVLTFKQDNLSLKVEGWMGVFKSAFIRNDEMDFGITSLKIMNKKLYYVCSNASDFMGVSDYKKVQLSFDDTTKDILGYECNHAVASVEDHDVLFDIYYTQNININRAAEFTPFIDIPGVLMEFNLSVNGIPMHVVANNIQAQEISMSEFAIPENYKKVNKAEVDEIFIGLIE